PVPGIGGVRPSGGTPQGAKFFDLTFPPDGRRLAVMDWFGYSLWDAAGGARLDFYAARSGTGVGRMAMRADGRLVAFAAGPEIHVRDPAGGEEGAPGSTGRRHLQGLAVSPAGPPAARCRDTPQT